MPAQQGADHERPQAQVDLGQAERRVVGRHDQVAAQHQPDPAGEAQPLHAGHDRDGAGAHRQHHLAQQPAALVHLQAGGVRGHLHQVGARAEDPLPGAGDEHDPGVARLPDRSEHRAQHVAGQRVALGLAVDVQPEHAALGGHLQVAHGGPSSAGRGD